jgi:iron complex outermembrane recepter protein
MSARSLVSILLAGVIGWAPPMSATSPEASEIVPPSLLVSGAAHSPKDAMDDGVFGDVVMEVELDVAGQVVRVVVLSTPDPRLSWAAMAAVASSSFSPARRHFADGRQEPTPIRFHTTLSFLPEKATGADVAAGLGVVRGVVHESGDERAIAGAHVHVASGSPASLSASDDVEFQTDGLGGFLLPPLPIGRHELLVDAPGFIPAVVSVDVVAGEQAILVHLDPLPVASREVVVTGRQSRQAIRRALTTSVAVIDAAALARTRGRSLADTVADVPGVTTIQSGPQQAKPVVRGVWGRRLVTLTDGVRHESQEWGLDHPPEIDPHAAGSITVVKGAAGVRYGADAIGGVIVVEPPALRLDPGLSGEVFFGGVSNGLRGEMGGRVDLVLPQLPGLSLRLEGNTARGASVSSPTYVLGNTGSAIDNVGAIASFRTLVWERALNATLTFRHHQSDLGICYCLKVTTPEGLRERLQAGPPPGAAQWTTTYAIDRPRQFVKHSLAVGRVELDLDVGALVASYAFQQDDREEFDQVRRAVQGPQYSFLLQTHAVDAVFSHRRARLGPWSLHGELGLHGDAQLHAYEGLLLIPNYRRFSGGVFGLERAVLKDLFGLGVFEVVGGVRADGLAMTSFLNERAYASQVRRGRLGADACAVEPGTDGGFDLARCDTLLPATSVSLGSRLTMPLWPSAEPTDTVSLQVDLSSASRFPDVDELYLSGPAPSFPVFGLGSAGLGTERTWQLSLGAELSTSMVRLEASAFASRVNDFIAFGPERGPDGRPVVDVIASGAYPRYSTRAIEAMMSGADAGVVLFPRALVALAAQGAMVRGRDLTGGGALPFLPPDQVRAELRVQPDHETIQGLSPTLAGVVHEASLTTGVVLVATQTRTDAGSDFAPPPPGYALWNAALTTELRLGGLPLQLGLEGRNLLDTQYRDAMSLMRFFADQPGREVWLRLAVRFDDVFADHDHDSHQAVDAAAVPHPGEP